MYVNEQHIMYKLADQLLDREKFEILELDEQREEIWLEKESNKTSYVIRLVHKEFYWINDLKKDIALAFHQTKAIRRLLSRKHRIEVRNVYVAKHPPVGEWESLKIPMQLKERNAIKLKVFYLDQSDLYKEKKRLNEDLNLSLELKADDYSDEEKETEIHDLTNKLKQKLYTKKQEMKNVLSHGKPFLTYIFLAMNILFFIFLEMNGGSNSNETLIKYGAKYNPAIVNGEWWRILSSMFIHIGLFHIFMNMLALYYLGPAVEKIYGSTRFFIVYMLAGIGGGLASFAFSSNISAGASGALFGLFGALLYFGLMNKKLFNLMMGKGIIVLIGINLIIGFTFPQIDNSAHIGGLVSGIVASFIVSLPGKRKTIYQIGALICYFIAISFLVVFGINHAKESAMYQLSEIEDLLAENNYQEVVQIATDALKDSDDLISAFLFQRSYSYIELGKPSLAIADLEKIVGMDSEMPEAYYNLAMLYDNQGKKQKAEKFVSKAYELNPEDESYINLYEQIMGEKIK
ncbi:rhomboid family intramembrane serine protease [Virgibacillus phasianinus]|uniref:Rhomboid family intramembrane serine protease n=1 Tax=Virgibacillus phasianinus TaxID=2017483 RepID=A0A220U652_9BACI|nr:rhomboid family intramembrane serine protease [Virgibacillus phasianinus]ASK63193.1 rhomboid family intramembrane serine protease [Virgibacillus phasianinus]